MLVNIVNSATMQKINVFAVEQKSYAVLEITPSQMTDNANVRWLIREFARYFKEFNKRWNITGGTFRYTPEAIIWWEVFLHKGAIKFYLIVPDDDIKDAIKRKVMDIWKRSTVKEVQDYMPKFYTDTTDVTRMTLENNPVLAIDAYKEHYSPLHSFLDASNYLKEDDMALLQIGMKPEGSSWNNVAQDMLERIRKNGGFVPRKKGKKITAKEVGKSIAIGVGIVVEEVMNLLGDLFIPAWEENKVLAESNKVKVEGGGSRATKEKSRDEGFKAEIRVVSQSDNDERRKAISRALIGGFVPLEGDNRLIEDPIENEKHRRKEIQKIVERKMTVRINGDVFGSVELARLINIPDRRMQIDHYNNLQVAEHRGESEVPKDVFKDDGGIPFAQYEDTDGVLKTVYFNKSNKDWFSLPIVVMGQQNTGKTTFGVNYALECFNRGIGGLYIDSADGRAIQRILDRVTPEQTKKVKILDFRNPEWLIGLTWNEAFIGNTPERASTLIASELIYFIEMVSGAKLSMTGKTWLKLACKAVFVVPDATILDVVNMLSNASYRAKVLPNIKDPLLRKQWERFHNDFGKKERQNIYEQIFRRMSDLMDDLQQYLCQKPKRDSNGDFLIDFRKWLDNGYLILIKANETLGDLQTPIVSFLISKMNLAVVSREDISNEDDRPSSFSIMDEPDHYIKGSERWRNMLTRYRKYRHRLLLMFHGWEQISEKDRSLPKIIQKAGAHYIVFQTDVTNLEKIRYVLEPEFSHQALAKGMPKHHAIIRLNIQTREGAVVPAFMAKTVDAPEKRFKKHNNDVLFKLSAEELGTHKDVVAQLVYESMIDAEFGAVDMSQDVSHDGEGELVDEDDDVA